MHVVVASLSNILLNEAKIRVRQLLNDGSYYSLLRFDILLVGLLLLRRCGPILIGLLLFWGGRLLLFRFTLFFFRLFIILVVGFLTFLVLLAGQILVNDSLLVFLFLDIVESRYFLRWPLGRLLFYLLFGGGRFFFL